MIPKIIHYCWFGENEKPSTVVKCINSWKEKLSDYKFLEWNETNYNIEELLYTRKNYYSKKYAFVSDVARLDVLYEYGGIYLDTDVMVNKSLNEFLDHKLFLGMMFNDSVGTAVIGAEKGNAVIYSLRKFYEEMSVSNSPNNDLFTKFFIDNYDEFILDNIKQVLHDSTTIYPKEYFERPTYSRKKGYSTHQVLNSWNSTQVQSNPFKKSIKKILGPVLIGKIQSTKILKKAAYYDVYLSHKKNR